MKKIVVLCFLLSGCAAPVLKEDFDPKGSITFDLDYELCDQMAQDLKRQFGWSQIPKTQCMYQKGYRLKQRQE